MKKETYKIVYNISLTLKNIETLTANIKLPDNYSIFSRVVASNIPDKYSLYYKDDKKYAKYSFSRPTSFSLEMEFDIETIPNGLANIKEYKKSGIIKPESLSTEQRRLYLQAEEKIESSDGYIKKLAESITAFDEERVLYEIHRIVADKITYTTMGTEYADEEIGAVRALKEGRGDCSEHTDAFVALCRAKGIPARALSGMVFFGGKEKPAMHAWAEVYMQNCGWVYFESTAKEWESAIELDPVYIPLSFTRHDNSEIICEYTYSGTPLIEMDLTYNRLKVKILAAKISFGKNSFIFKSLFIFDRKTFKDFFISIKDKNGNPIYKYFPVNEEENLGIVEINEGNLYFLPNNRNKNRLMLNGSFTEDKTIIYNHDKIAVYSSDMNCVISEGYIEIFNQ